MIRIRYLLKRIWRWSSFDSKETVSWSTSPPLPLSYAHYLSNTSTLFSPLISTFNAFLSSDSDIHPPKRESKSLLFFFVWPTSDLASATNFHLKTPSREQNHKGFRANQSFNGVSGESSSLVFFSVIWIRQSFDLFLSLLRKRHKNQNFCLSLFYLISSLVWSTWSF